MIQTPLPGPPSPQGGLCARSLKGKGKYISFETKDGTVATWTNSSPTGVDFSPGHGRCVLPPVVVLALHRAPHETW